MSITYSAVAVPSLAAQATMHKALGDVARQHMLRLIDEGDGTLSVQEIEDALAVRLYRFSQPTVSYHLRILERAGLISLDHRHGTHKYYGVCRDALAALAETLGGVK